MDDYKQLAHKKYLQKRKIIIDEEASLQKQLEEEQKKKDDEEKRIKEIENKKQVFIQSIINNIDESIASFTRDDTDDNIILIITNIISSLESVLNIIDHAQKEYITNKIIEFTNLVDKMNTTRPKNINTIANIKILSEGFARVYELLGLDIEIITLDTDNDEYIAHDLSRPSHLSCAANAAIERAKKAEVEKATQQLKKS